MRVLVVGARYPDSFADNLVASLEDAGHDARVEAPFRGFLGGTHQLAVRGRQGLGVTPKLTARLQEHVVEAAEEHRAELVINLDSRLSFHAVSRIREASGAPVVFWFPDAPGRNLGRETHVLAGYDALFLKDSGIVDRYRRLLGLNAHFLPEACNPRWHRPLGDLGGPTAHPVVLVAGNVYATRFVLLQALAAAGVELAIYGPSWARWLPRDERLAAAYTHRYLAREEKAREFRRATVVLNALASHEADGLNCRLFEAAACGAVVLTERRPRLEEFFEVPEEVRAFSSFEELLDGVRQLAGLPAEERAQIADAASARAHANHAYGNRFAAMLAILGAG